MDLPFRRCCWSHSSSFEAILSISVGLLASFDAETIARADFVACSTNSEPFRSFVVTTMDTEDAFNWTLALGDVSLDMRASLSAPGSFQSRTTPMELQATIHYLLPLFPMNRMYAWKAVQLHLSDAERCFTHSSDQAVMLTYGCLCTALLTACVLGSLFAYVSLANNMRSDDTPSFERWLVPGIWILAALFVTLIIGVLMFFVFFEAAIYAWAPRLTVQASSAALTLWICFGTTFVLLVASIRAWACSRLLPASTNQNKKIDKNTFGVVDKDKA